VQLIEQRLGTLAVVALLVGCGQQADSSFCATHAGEHWRHRAELPRLEIEYADSGIVEVELALPSTLADKLPTLATGDILALPEFCEVGHLRRRDRYGDVSLRFQADCAGQQPDSLAVPLLQKQQEILEVEVSMSTPAVRKHFIVHRQCERALFNVTAGIDSE
jgi:hypothetical protein